MPVSWFGRNWNHSGESLLGPVVVKQLPRLVDYWLGLSLLDIGSGIGSANKTKKECRIVFELI